MNQKSKACLSVTHTHTHMHTSTLSLSLSLSLSLLSRPPMPYNLFFSEVYSMVLQANPQVSPSIFVRCLHATVWSLLPQMGFSEASKIISMMWNAMGSEAKQVISTAAVPYHSLMCTVSSFHCPLVYSLPSLPPSLPLTLPLSPTLPLTLPPSPHSGTIPSMRN